MTTLVRITVKIDGGSAAFDGYTDGRLWNGWQCPWFTIAVAEQMCASIGFRTRRASIYEAPHGGLWVNQSDDGPNDEPYLLKGDLVTTVDGDQPLIDCGGWLVFLPVTKQEVPT